MYFVFMPQKLHIKIRNKLKYKIDLCCNLDTVTLKWTKVSQESVDLVSCFQTIFIFIIKQLSGLKDPKDPAFKRYFYLLENLAYVKSFNMCFELEDNQEIFCTLFNLMFNIVKYVLIRFRL